MPNLEIGELYDDELRELLAFLSRDEIIVVRNKFGTIVSYNVHTDKKYIKDLIIKVEQAERQSK